MRSDSFEVLLDGCTKFFSTLRINGWAFVHDDSDDALASITLNAPFIKAQNIRIGMPHGGVSALGQNLGFELEVLFDEAPTDPLMFTLEFRTRRGRVVTAHLKDWVEDRLARMPLSSMGKQFRERLNAVVGPGRKPRLLDIGGRSRSGFDRAAVMALSGCDVTVLDVLPGDNVDVVGDAHVMGDFFPRESFDGVYSISVFEHLMMPWRVTAEMNKILRPGGLGWIYTHQTIGMHDMPWDFWRFSDSAWDVLFNKKSGFEVVDRALDYPQYILPFHMRAGKMDAEASCGFEGSAVIFKKIGSADLSWNMLPADVGGTMYPEGEDGHLDGEVLRHGL